MDQPSNPNNTNTTNGTPRTLDDLAVMVRSGFDELKDEMDRQSKELSAKINAKPSQRHVDSRFDGMEKIIANDVVASSVLRDRTLDKKGNAIADKLATKEIFSFSDVEDIRIISPVAVSPAP